MITQVFNFLLRRKRRTKKTRRAVRRFETFEPRYAFSAVPLDWGATADLTLSFVPDGTDIAGQNSAMFAQFNQITGTSNWQEHVVRAFQTWAQYTNADIGVVLDGGQPLGSDGATQGDGRFGDIRVGAIPMRQDVFAISVTQDVVAGTWAGDLLFNSEFAFANADEIYRVALHEAGNIFGLPDNQDPQSPLYSAGVIPSAVVPTANDIAALQLVYGSRVHDLEDAHDPNGILTMASEIRYSDDDGFTGATPLILHGDLTDNNDVDWFKFEVPVTYAGLVTASLRTSGVSVLRPQISLHDEVGVQMAFAETVEVFGSRLSITWTTPEEGNYFLRISAVAADPYAIGEYVLAVTLDGVLQTSLSTLDTFTDGRLRGLTQDQIQNIFLPEDGESAGLFNDELHTDDDVLSANFLTPVPGFTVGTRFRASASISNVTDIDAYRIDTPASVEPWVGSFRVRGVDGLLSVETLELVDSLGAVYPTEVLVNNGRDLIVQATGLTPNSRYTLRVVASPGLSAAVSSNYRLDIALGDQAVLMQELALGTLTSQNASSVHSLHVPTWQLVHFVLDVPAGGYPIKSVELRLLDQAGGVGLRLSSVVGESHSGFAKLLPPGDYQLVVMTYSNLIGLARLVQNSAHRF
ncbi:MAG: hypothetical protein O3C60_02255 [Planctomycetota bacterium]|nr:hypothetical protein [Planctomycetota bacterium]